MNTKIKELAIKHNLITDGMVGGFYTEALTAFADDLIADLKKQNTELAERLQQRLALPTPSLREIAEDRDALSDELGRAQRRLYDVMLSRDMAEQEKNEAVEMLEAVNEFMHNRWGYECDVEQLRISIRKNAAS